MYALIENFPDSYLAREFDPSMDYRSLLEFINAYLDDGQVVTLATIDIIEDLREDGFDVEIVVPS